MSAEVLSARSGWRISLLRGLNSMRAFNFRLSELPTHVRLLLVAEIDWITLVVAMLTLAIRREPHQRVSCKLKTLQDLVY